MKILYAASEALPYASTGGLADVVGSLPQAVKKELGEGADVRVVIPLYSAIRRKFAEEMTDRGIVDAIRAEEGNERYEYFFPMEDVETVLLIDRWKDQEALDIHHKSEMMKQIAELRDKYKLHLRVERYVEESCIK